MKKRLTIAFVAIVVAVGALGLFVSLTGPGWRIAAYTVGTGPGYLPFVQGYGRDAIERIAGLHGNTLGKELVEQVRASPEIADHAWFIARSDRKAFEEISAMVARARLDSGTPEHLQDWLDHFEEEQGLVHPAEYSRISAELRKHLEAGDVASLRAYFDDRLHDRLHRLLAATYLAQLGDARPLDLFAEPSTRRSGQAFLILKELMDLREKTSGPVRVRVEELISLYGNAQHPFEKVKGSVTVPRQ